MNNQPFYVGQKVVALASSPNTDESLRVVKGRHYTVANQYYCAVCRNWIIGLSELEYTGTYRVTRCCSDATSPSNYLGGPADKFAPVQYQYEDCREELASQVTVGDTCDQPVRVLTN